MATTRDIAAPGPLMAGKRGLVMGVANDRSIAWGIARVLHGQGAELAFSYQGGAFGRRAVPLAKGIGAKIIVEADVEDLQSVERVFEAIRKKWGSLDFVVHALAFSDRNELKGRYCDTTRKNFEHTMVISCFSFTEICKLAAAMMPQGGSLLTLTYGGATRVVPCYNVMGVAKAALEDERALSRLRFRPARDQGQCALGGADAHACRRGHLGRAHAVPLSSSATRRCAARRPSTRWAAPPSISCRICRARSPAKSISWTAATRPSPCRTFLVAQGDGAKRGARRSRREGAGAAGGRAVGLSDMLVGVE